MAVLNFLNIFLILKALMTVNICKISFFSIKNFKLNSLTKNILKYFNFKYFLVFFFSFFIFNHEAFAGVTSCNINRECQFGFVCISGNAQAVDTNTGITRVDGNGNPVAPLQGECVPTVPMREACYFYSILTGNLGRAIVALVLISLGIAWTTGKIEKKHLLTVFIGIVLFFGSFQVVEYFMGVKGRGYCNLIDYSQPVGIPSQKLIDNLLLNS